MNWFFEGIKIFVASALLLLVFFLLIPVGFKIFNQWVATRKPRMLGELALIGFFSLLIFCWFDMTVVNLVYKYNGVLSRLYVLQAFLILGITIFIAYFSVPKLVRVFLLWKQRKLPGLFSKMVFLGMLSLCGFSILFTLLLPRFFL